MAFSKLGPEQFNGYKYRSSVSYNLHSFSTQNIYTLHTKEHVNKIQFKQHMLQVYKHSLATKKHKFIHSIRS